MTAPRVVVSERTYSPGPDSPEERFAGVALGGASVTAAYYLLPTSLQQHGLLLFLPQAVAYLGLLAWLMTNRHRLVRLGLRRERFSQGLRWGVVTGLCLGMLNVWVILWVVPRIGGDIGFLRATPHARMPTAVMFPWTIIVIAVLVELNFRGFLLGRLLAIWRQCDGRGYDKLGGAVAVGASAVVFAFDPFMVATFKHLHWIAVWDGVVWGTLWLRLRNLYAPIVAHAVEVVVLYVVLKRMLSA